MCEEATQFINILQSSTDAEAMMRVTEEPRKITDWYQREFGAPAEDQPVPDVEEPIGLDHDEILLLEGLLHGKSLLNSNVEGDVDAQGGHSLLSEDSASIQEVKTPHSVRFACSVASATTGKSNVSAKYDTMTGEDESRIGANVVAKLIGPVDLEFTDLLRFDEFKRRIHSVPEAMDELKKKRGFSALDNRTETTME